MDTATTDTYTLSLHDALPISSSGMVQTLARCVSRRARLPASFFQRFLGRILDRKSTRLNSSHVARSYAVFCLKKKIMKGQQVREHQRVVVRRRQQMHRRLADL